MERKSSRRTFALTCAGSLLAWPALHAQTAERNDTIMALLDRIDRIVAAARKEAGEDDLAPVGEGARAGASATLEIRAANLDEIRAEIAQIKLLLQKAQ
jgi:hypothetical protein